MAIRSSWRAIYSFGVLHRLHGRAARGDPAAHDASRRWRGRSALARTSGVRGVELPVPALVGAPLTFAVWVLALVTHSGARYVGPLWLAVGLAVFVAVRQTQRRGLLEQVVRRGASAGCRVQAHPRSDEARRHRRGDGRDRGRARQGARTRRSRRSPWCAVPRRYALEGPLPADVAARVDASLEEARLLGAEHGVEVADRRRPRAVDRLRDRRRGARAPRPT